MKVDYLPNGQPESAYSAIQFVPNRVTNDVLTPTEAGRVSDGVPDSPPTVYRATSGPWAPDFQVRVYRSGSDMLYYTQRNTSDGHVYVFKSGSTDPVFDITAWDTTRQIGPGSPEFMFDV